MDMQQLMRLSGTTIAYAAVMLVLAVAVGFMLTKMARTDLADRRLLLIGGVLLIGIVAGGLAMVRFRSKDE